MMGVTFSDGCFTLAVNVGEGLYTVQIVKYGTVYIETIPAESESEAITKAHEILEKQTQEVKR